MYVVVVGAGQVGYYLTKTLLSKGYEVTLVDWNFNKVQLLEQELGGVVLYASGSSIDGLEKAGCSRADVIVAVTGDDEDNLVICQLGKRYFKVPKAIARINNPKNESVFKELGVGTTISGTTSIADAIERYVAKQQLCTLLTFDHDEMALLEAELDYDSPVVDKTIGEIPLPYECIIALILRGRNVVFAKGDTVLKAKDLVIAISTKNEQENLRKILLGDSEV
ncbi:MAG: TrkA family potassium uptake protein [Clostridia bacterium]|nr:TrkA family potassium uptake protein [Clostridia bacterium]